MIIKSAFNGPKSLNLGKPPVPSIRGGSLVRREDSSHKMQTPKKRVTLSPTTTGSARQMNTTPPPRAFGRFK